MVKKQIVQLKENKKRTYLLVIGQCPPDLDSKLQGSAAFLQAEADQDVVQLLLVIQGYCCRFDNHQQSMWALEQAKHRVSIYYQGHNVTNTEYVEHFKALVGVVETYGGAYGPKPRLVTTELVAQGMKSQDVDTTDCADIKKAKEVCPKCYLWCMLLCRTDNSRYYQLKVDLSNNMTKGPNNFPKTMVKTMRILTDYVPLPRLQRAHNPDGDELAFVQGKDGALRGPKKDSANKEVECWHCGGPHYKNECPELKLLGAGIQNIIVNSCNEEHTLFSSDDRNGLVQKQAKGVWGILSPHHMYIDTCASYTSIPYTHLLANLKKQARGLAGHSTAGLCSMSSSGEMEMGALKKVWLNKGSVAAILPLKELEKLWHVVYDSRRHGGAFVLRTDAGDIVLKNNNKGMPYFDLKEFEVYKGT